MTNNANTTAMLASQAQKEVTFNDFREAIDALCTQKLSISISTVTPITLVRETQSHRASSFTLDNAGSPPVANFVLRFPAFDRGFVRIKNNTSFVATVEISGQTGPPTLQPGEQANFYVTSTAVEKDEPWLSASDYKASVRVATTANITTASDLNAGDTIDGVTLAAGDRVLVKDQSTATQNGIYVAGATPARAGDADSNYEVTANMTVRVSEGTLNADRTYQLTTNDPIVLGSTNLVFAESGGGSGSGISWIASVRVATTANGTLATAFENGDTIDGVVLATGDRILLKDQSTAADNGIYIVAASGAPTRATDYDLGGVEVKSSTAIPVREGTANGGKIYILTTLDPITVGATSLNFFLFGIANYGTAVTTDTGTTYTFVLADANGYKRHTNAGAITVTVPANSTVAYPIGTQLSGIQGGAGQVTFVGAGGVTINTPETLKLRKNKSTYSLTKVGTDEWDLAGDLELV